MESKIDLHVHPFFERYGLDAVVKAMDKKGMDCIGLPQLDKNIYPYVQQQAKEYNNAFLDEKGVMIPDRKIIFDAKEYNTKEGFQLLTVGGAVESPQAPAYMETRKIIDEGLEQDALVVFDHPFADNVYTKTAGNISDEKAKEVEDICKEYPGKIAMEYNGYSNPLVRKMIKWGFNTGPLFWLLQKSPGLPEEKIGYSDINKKALELSEKLSGEGYNVPIVADTDLHARRKHSLNKMGTACFRTNVSYESASQALAGIKENIFNGDYRNSYNTVGMFHLGRTYLPQAALQGLFLKPRG